MDAMTSDAVLNALFGVVEAGLCLLDAHGQVVKVSPAWLTMTGLNSEQVLGRELWEFFPDQTALHRALHDEVRAGKTVLLPEQLCASRALWYSARLSPVAMNEGVGVLITTTDVTERRRAEESRRESEERFRLMADSAPALIWVTDREGGNQFVNRTFREYFRVTIEDVEGNKWQPLIHPEDAPAYIASFQRSLAERRRFEGEMRVKRNDDPEWRWLASVAEPRFSASGELVGMIGISLDVTERRSADDAIRATRDELAVSNERFRQLAETIHEVFWLADPLKKKLVYVSPAYELIWGRTVESLHASPQGWLDAVHPEDRERVSKAALLQRDGAHYD
ncbi:MAG TPA: PAS domain S-box protein, partial [Polyangiaceae bacterium]